MSTPKTPANRVAAKPGGAHGLAEHLSQKLLQAARSSAEAVLQEQGATVEGLASAEAEERLEKYGPNETVRQEQQGWLRRLLGTMANPLVVLLSVLAAISLLTGDIRAALMMLVMVVLGVLLRFFQEARADAAAEELRAMVSTTAAVIRDGRKQEIPLKLLVPGDIVCLSAGDMVPADVRLLTAKDLFVNQASLTGEAMPVEKSISADVRGIRTPLEAANLCFMGTNMEIGAATAVVLTTGGETYFGSLAKNVANQTVQTSFDVGISKFTWLMIGFIGVMVPAVFLINGLSKHDWLQAFLFAMAVAVGLTPEMLPMIVTVNLSKGAISMSRKKVIVKRLNAIQNFGAMDVLCTDKTGTITQGKVILEQHIDIHGDESQRVLDYAYLNSYYQTGLRNLLDVAVLDHHEVQASLKVSTAFHKVDEIPFDFLRRRMSVVVEDSEHSHILICKGAVEELLQLCTWVQVEDHVVQLDDSFRKMAQGLVHGLNEDGFRVLALSYKQTPAERTAYSVKDEAELTLLGFLAFLDPPKETTPEALRQLDGLGVQVKILTGDNEVVTRKVGRQVGLRVDNVLLGGDIEGMPDEELAERAEGVIVFAKLSPAHKERIIRALQRKGHVVGFLGDGINDAPALHAADVGISVDSAVDIAKESSQIILLENSLLVLRDGVAEGRRVFGNILKYIKMAASSNFGNMFSVVGGSIFLPFLPMLPMQILTNNLLYDFSQISIPTDEVDADWLAKPRKWVVSEIRRFIILIGPMSSIFDYATYLIMLFIFGAWLKPDAYHQALFHTGWFVESLFSQTLIIHVIRTNKIPFIQSRASVPLTLTSLAIVTIGGLLPYSPLAGALGFVPLPPLYWGLLVLMLLCYLAITQAVKAWFVRRYGGN
jgi:Mg2+-importing ATPase